MKNKKELLFLLIVFICLVCVYLLFSNIFNNNKEEDGILLASVSTPFNVVKSDKKTSLTNKQVSKNLCTTSTLFISGAKTNEVTYTVENNKVDLVKSNESTGEYKFIIKPNSNVLKKDEKVDIEFVRKSDNKKAKVTLVNNTDCESIKVCSELQSISINHGGTKLTSEDNSKRTISLKKNGHMGIFLNVNPINTNYKASDISWMSSDLTKVEILYNGQTNQSVQLYAKDVTKKAVKISASLGGKVVSFNVKVLNKRGNDVPGGMDNVPKMVDCTEKVETPSQTNPESNNTQVPSNQGNTQNPSNNTDSNKPNENKEIFSIEKVECTDGELDGFIIEDTSGGYIVKAEYSEDNETFEEFKLDNNTTNREKTIVDSHNMWRFTNSNGIVRVYKITCDEQVVIPNKDDSTSKKPEENNKPTNKKIDISKVKVEKITDKQYTGSAIKPTPGLSFENKKLRINKDYKLSYKDNIKVGKATITIEGLGDFIGTRTVNFNIVNNKTVPNFLTISLKENKNCYKVPQTIVINNPKGTNIGLVKYSKDGKKTWKNLSKCNSKKCGIKVTSAHKSVYFQAYVYGYEKPQTFNINYCFKK